MKKRKGYSAVDGQVGGKKSVGGPGSVKPKKKRWRPRKNRGPERAEAKGEQQGKQECKLRGNGEFRVEKARVS